MLQQKYDGTYYRISNPKMDLSHVITIEDSPERITSSPITPNISLEPNEIRFESPEIVDIIDMTDSEADDQNVPPTMEWSQTTANFIKNTLKSAVGPVEDKFSTRGDISSTRDYIPGNSFSPQSQTPFFAPPMLRIQNSPYPFIQVCPGYCPNIQCDFQNAQNYYQIYQNRSLFRDLTSNTSNQYYFDTSKPHFLDPLAQIKSFHPNASDYPEKYSASQFSGTLHPKLSPNPPFSQNLHSDSPHFPQNLQSIPSHLTTHHPYRLESYSNGYNLQKTGQNFSMPAFVDVNSWENRPCVKFSRPTGSSTMYSQTTYCACDCCSFSKISDEKKVKNPVPLFLKRSRPTNCVNMGSVSIKQEFTPNNVPLSSTNSAMKIDKIDLDVVYDATIQKEDDDDVLFVTEYKINKIENVPQPENFLPTPNLEDNTFKVPIPLNKSSPENRNNGATLRRNPKRKTQTKDEKKDGPVKENDKEEANKKPVNKRKKAAKIDPKNCRRSLRNLAACGSIYRPPSPISRRHIRDWPVNGMHERPEYDPVTGRIEPFDQSIRNIAKQYELSKTKDSNISKTDEKFSLEFSKKSPKKTSFPKLCHDVFHESLALAATVIKMQDDEIVEKQKPQKSKSLEENPEKKSFLENFALYQLVEDPSVAKLETGEKSPNSLRPNLDQYKKSLQSSKNGPKSHKDQKSPSPTSSFKKLDLKELITGQVLLYCLTHNIEGQNLAKYLEELDPNELIQWSYEQVSE